MQHKTYLFGTLIVLGFSISAVLGFFVYRLTDERNMFQAKLYESVTLYNEKIRSLNETRASLKQKTSELDRAETNVRGLNTTLTSTRAELQTYRDRSINAEAALNSVRCRYMLDPKVVAAARENGDIRTDILAVLEKTYRGNVESSSFVTYWRDAKDAMFTTYWDNNSSGKVIISWGGDKNSIRSIFDVSSSCLLYMR
jgi:hypothetical protein